ncbi:MAG: PQQ-binding-like beta-propeller repeat protein [Planctomycetia bacterium]|nr:PQQ-binding-like beta-propeller repeat protein [Planctomycetia bacterium]
MPCFSWGQEKEDAGKALFPVPRATRDEVENILKLLADKDYATATEKLQKIVLGQDDYFLARSLVQNEENPEDHLVCPGTTTRTLQTDLPQLFDRLDSSERDLLLLASESTAEEQYRAALAGVNVDRALLAAVSTGFPLTDAGKKAAILLAALRLHDGYRLTTDDSLRRILSLPADARAAFEPTVTLLAAEAALTRDDQKTALQLAENLFTQFPNLTFSLDNVAINNAEELTAFLEQKIHQEQSAGPQDPDRLADSKDAANSTPVATDEFSQLCWTDRITPVEREVLKRELFFPSAVHGQPQPVAPRPLLMNGQLVRYSGLTLTARDVARGELVWSSARAAIEIPDSLKPSYEGTVAQTGSAVLPEQFALCGSVFMSRNATESELVPAGSRILHVESALPGMDRRVATTDGDVALPLPELWRGNTLLARDAATGEVLWSVGRVPYINGLLSKIADLALQPGATTSGEFDVYAESLSRDKLGQVYFCGPPLVHDDRVYIIGEDEIGPSLFVLALEDGRLLFQRRFAAALSPISQDCLRSFYGIKPLLYDNLLFCPGSQGQLAAFDFDSLRLRWLFVPHTSPLPSRGGSYREALTAVKVAPLPWKPLRLDLRNDGTLTLAMTARDTIYSLDPSSGRLLQTETWSSQPQVGSMAETGSGPLVTGEFLIRPGLAETSVWSRTPVASPAIFSLSEVERSEHVTSGPGPAPDVSQDAVTLAPPWPEGEIDPIQRAAPTGQPHVTKEIQPRLPAGVSIVDDTQAWHGTIRGPVVTADPPEATDGTTQWHVDHSGQLVATDLTNGTTLWTYPEGDLEVFTDLAQRGSELYLRVATPTEERLRLLDAATGNVQKESVLPEGIGAFTGLMACRTVNDESVELIAIPTLMDASPSAVAQVGREDLILRLPHAHLLAVCSGQGRLVVCDTQRCAILVDIEQSSPDSAGPVTGFNLWRDQEGLLALFWYEPQHIQRPSTKIESVCEADERPIVCGLCQRFNEQGEPQWLVPEELYDTFYLRTQPSELPVLVFAKRVTSDRRGSWLAVRALDKRTGELRFNAKLPDCDLSLAAPDEFPVFASFGDEAGTLKITCRDQEFLFQFKEPEDDVPQEE